jgi:hypothetical protein
MKPDEFVPYLTKAQNKYRDKLKEIEIRRESLKQQFDSDTNNSKKDSKTKNIDTKLDAINKREEQSSKYYYDEIERAETKYRESVDILERKLKDYKKICNDHIERLRDKYNNERDILENKKEIVDNPFDESNDKLLNKLKLELEHLKNDKEDAEATMKSLEVQEVNRAKTRLREEQEDARQAEIARLLRERAIAEQRAYETFYDRCDEEEKKREIEYNAYQEQVKKEKEEKLQEVIQENIKLHKMKLELEKKWNKKQEKTYRSLSKLKRIEFLSKDIDEVLRLLTVMS